MDSNKRKGASVPKAKTEERVGQRNKDLISPYLKQVALQMMLPGECSSHELVVSPSSAPSTVCVRHLHKVIDVNSTTFPGGFVCAMFPNLHMPGYISSPVNVSLPPVGVGVVSAKGKLLFKPNYVNIEGHLRLTDATGGHVETRIVPIADLAGTERWGFSITPTATTKFTYNVKAIGKSDASFTLHLYYKLAGGNWTQIVVVALGQGIVNAQTETLPANADSFAWSITGSTDQMVDVHLAFNSAQINSTAINSLAPGFSDFILSNDLEYGRVISMSLLATNTSPDLANGGNINIGRVPNGFHHFDKIPENMANLPDNRRYQGPARNGGFCTWIPDEIDEFEIDTLSNKLEAYSHAEFILCKVDSWGGAGAVSSFKLQFDWIVEFYTPEQIFEKIPTPPISDEFKVLFFMMSTMPAAMCNPAHTDGVKEMFKKVAHVLKSGADFYGTHKKLIDGVMHLALSTLL